MAISTQEQRTSWIEYVADGSVKRFDIPFEYLTSSHIVVRDDDTIKTASTDYTIDENTKTNGYPEIVFGTAPTTAHVVRLARHTPKGSVYSEDPQRGGLDALQARFLAEEAADVPILVPFFVNATDLAAPTNPELISSIDGYVGRVRAKAQVAIVTGGTLTLEINTVAVNGLAVVIADSMAVTDPSVSDTPTSGHASTRVNRGDRLEVVVDSAFNGGGALNGVIELWPGPVPS